MGQSQIKINNVVRDCEEMKEKIGMKEKILIFSICIIVFSSIAFAFSLDEWINQWNKVFIGIDSEPVVTTGITGMAVSPTCIDSDGGKNYDVYGTVTKIYSYGNRTYADSCTDSKNLNEKYCIGNYLYTATYDCSKVGKVCKDGACIKEINETIISRGICIDSDRGINIYSKGITNKIGKNLLKGMTKLTDQCSNRSSVIEYYCNGTEINSANVPCPSGYVCRNGACIINKTAPTPTQIPCDDSDSGFEPYAKGAVVIGNNTYEDTCVIRTTATDPSTELETSDCEGTTCYNKEFSCLNNNVSSSIYKCGFGCQDGRCITSCEKLFVIIGTKYGGWCTNETQTGYDKRADVTNDRTIDFFDLATVGRNYGDEPWCLDQLYKQTNPCITS